MPDLKFLRKVEYEDFDAIAELTQRNGFNIARIDLELYYDMDPDGFFVYCENNKVIEGFFSLMVFGRTACFALLMVGEETRKKGLGTFLMNFAVELVKKRGCSRGILYGTRAGRKMYIEKFFFNQTGINANIYLIHGGRNKLDISVPSQASIIPFTKSFSTDFPDAFRQYTEADAVFFGDSRDKLYPRLDCGFIAVSCDRKTFLGGISVKGEKELSLMTGMLYAVNDEIAEALFKTVLNSYAQFTVRLTCNSDNLFMLDLIKAQPFEVREMDYLTFHVRFFEDRPQNDEDLTDLANPNGRAKRLGFPLKHYLIFDPDFCF